MRHSEKKLNISSIAGSDADKSVYVAIKGTVFDVSRNPAYRAGGQYHGMSLGAEAVNTRGYNIYTDCLTFKVFAGKDPSRALATSSLKPEDCVPDWSDLEDKHKTVLDEWYTFFSKRYNIVGKVSS
jgi:membrane-associated progesterone receptor component